LKNFTITFLVLFASIKLSAINFDGTLLTLDGDTIHCEIQFSDFNTYAHKGEILSTKKITVLIDGKKMTYAADELMNYSVLINKTWKTYWGVNTIKKKYQFMKREVDGKLTLYSAITYSSINLRYNWQYVFVKQELSARLYLEHGTSSNKQKLTKFLAECPVTTGLFYSGVIDIGNPAHWKLIAQKYNAEC